MLTRRRFAALTAAGAAAGLAGPARAEPPTPVIIAEGGAAEERIGDTRSAFDLAINQGADFIQANLFPSQEGALVVRRDSELSASTDVASRAAFASRRTTKTIDGQPVTGWFTEDFTLAELQQLACREASPKLRPQTARFDGKETVLSLADLLQIAQAGCVRTARTVGVCVRLLRPAAYADAGLDLTQRLASDLATAGYRSPASAVWVQCHEAEALQAFGRLSRLRRMRLIGLDDADQTTSAALADIHGYAEAISPDQDLLIDPAAAAFPVPTTLAMDAHNAGLQVFSRTVLPQNQFLPAALRRGDRHSPSFDAQHGDVDRLLVALFLDGVDGLSTDLPGQAQKARDAAMDALRSGKRTFRT